MMKKMILAATIVGGMAAGFSGQAVAAHHHAPPPPPPGGCGMMGGPGGPGGFGMPFLGNVQLTAAQHKKLKAILQDSHPDFRADMEKEHQLHKQIQDLLVVPGKVDEAQIVSLQQQITAIHQQHEAGRLQTAIRIHDILTTDQLNQIRDTQDKVASLHEQLRALTAPPAPEDAKK
ncbi:periplasmic heavy metal sensor [Komagataeibacter oboediens]|uniref:Periplasmic heavy metal sensor n=1 Tax=Komagataeibacter oboediens TaxID=65958 RepID=A0ABS5SM16_9PROT|nr:periplasmic heavy metal sensor [Komagataeibacter oboediens]MBL7233822.1 periplasmic heavy metal sensor [Komagataeibacter oboediens]MBT0674827.1 periplasmic heavy metal sensor [Komagataeibacter oboediens]MBT0678625.1 periplasmic heavy metal sensor [Komagataeibacter oboediens]